MSKRSYAKRRINQYLNRECEERDLSTMPKENVRFVLSNRVRMKDWTLLTGRTIVLDREMDRVASVLHDMFFTMYFDESLHNVAKFVQADKVLEDLQCTW